MKIGMLWNYKTSGIPDELFLRTDLETTQIAKPIINFLNQILEEISENNKSK